MVTFEGALLATKAFKKHAYLDRPFYYAIVHNHSAMLVFAEAVNKLLSITEA